MKLEAERRNYERHPIQQTPISWGYLNSPVFHSGMLINYSKGGSGFVSEYPAQPGATIFIKREETSDVACGEVFEGFPSANIAEIRWCKKRSENGTTYQIGVAYIGMYDY